MNKNLSKILLASVLLITGILSFNSSSAAPGKNYTLRLLGTDVGEMRTIPAIQGSGTTQALCFDLDVLDIKTNKKIGTGVDCLADITPIGNGLSVVGTTYFHLPEGTLVTRGLTTVQPTTGGSTPVTHITGSIPSLGDNNVIDGTKRFAGATAPVRLSGAVNMANLQTLGEIFFDCLFIVDLDK